MKMFVDERVKLKHYLLGKSVDRISSANIVNLGIAATQHNLQPRALNFIATANFMRDASDKINASLLTEVNFS